MRSETKDDKSALRTKMLAVRAGIDDASRNESSEAACRRLEAGVLAPLRESKCLRSPEAKRTGLTVFMYLSFRDELSTNVLLQTCLAQGDTVIVPKVSENGRLTLHELDHHSRIQPAGRWGIPEPAHAPVWPKSRYREIDFVAVPGLAFDDKGGRLGYGGGYYDRFMEELHESCGGGPLPLMGALLFEEQLVTRVPAEPHDLRLDLLVTASRFFYINKR